MENLKALTEEDRMRLAVFLQSDEWKLVERIADIIINAGRVNCSTFRASDPPAQQSFNQGCVSGLIDFKATIALLGKRAAEKPEEQEPLWKAPLRTGTTGIY
jgi:hypothetical protein